MKTLCKMTYSAHFFNLFEMNICLKSLFILLFQSDSFEDNFRVYEIWLLRTVCKKVVYGIPEVLLQIYFDIKGGLYLIMKFFDD